MTDQPHHPNHADVPQHARVPSRSRADDDAPRPHSPALGVVSVLLAAAAFVIVGVGVSTSMRGGYATGTMLAYVATGVSIVAVLGGLAAVLMARGRGWGLVAIVLGLCANPLLLTKILGWASGLG